MERFLVISLPGGLIALAGRFMESDDDPPEEGEEPEPETGMWLQSNSNSLGGTT